MYFITSYVLSVLQIKCDQYWPTRGTELYGVMHITLVDVVELATYTIRTFLVTRVRFCDMLWYINAAKLIMILFI